MTYVVLDESAHLRHLGRQWKAARYFDSQSISDFESESTANGEVWSGVWVKAAVRRAVGDPFVLGSRCRSQCDVGLEIPSQVVPYDV